MFSMMNKLIFLILLFLTSTALGYSTGYVNGYNVLQAAHYSNIHIINGKFGNYCTIAKNESEFDWEPVVFEAISPKEIPVKGVVCHNKIYLTLND